MAFKICLFLLLATTSYVNSADCDINYKPYELYTVCASASAPAAGRAQCNNKLKLCSGKTEVPGGKTIDCPDGLVCPPKGTSCVAESSDCEAVPITFKCTSKGTFPDPKNCRRYFECSKIDETGADIGVNTCKDTEVFSETTGACKVSAIPAECITVDCKTTMGNGFFSPYGTGKKYFGLCTEDTKTKVTTISMFQCADGAEFDRTVSVSGCVFKCAAELKYAYSLDKQMYYECKRQTDGKITATLQKCSGTQIFDPTKRTCKAPSRFQKF